MRETSYIRYNIPLLLRTIITKCIMRMVVVYVQFRMHSWPSFSSLARAHATPRRTPSPVDCKILYICIKWGRWRRSQREREKRILYRGIQGEENFRTVIIFFFLIFFLSRIPMIEYVSKYKYNEYCKKKKAWVEILRIFQQRSRTIKSKVKKFFFELKHVRILKM